MRLGRIGAILVLALTSVATAGAQTDPSLDLTRVTIQADRSGIVRASIVLTDEEDAAFWPVYDAYQEEMSKVRDRLADLVIEYLDRHATLEDADAARLLDEFLEFQQTRVAVKQKYVSRFRKVLPARKVVQLYQLDHRMDIIIDHEVSKDTPLAR